MIDAVKLLAVMRPKLEIPLAEGRRSGGMRPNEIVSIKQSGGIALYAI